MPSLLAFLSAVHIIKPPSTPPPVGWGFTISSKFVISALGATLDSETADKSVDAGTKNELCLSRFSLVSGYRFFPI
ncbi:hypothetical protein [Microcoleus sp. FACHB-672]|uniref:hypothetical protein n=1 Tax=Microcoleus sp. FACHB-672 TaxID=2692825 RepID=UPI00168535BB|nr:hypothetical protein [Microcoleus sp. FACHB-672]MBD2041401.1 hypothetical protein [Microcoleus sp. FACHB-672]